MGTDIHIIAEVYTEGKWVRAKVDVPEDRNYWTFAILANVRNGYGFAGFSTGEAVPYINKPRGLPEGRSKRCKKWLGDHSFSWLTLEELLAYPYDGEMTTIGMVTKEEADKFRATGLPPTEWCAMTNSEGYETITWKRPLKEAAWLFGRIIETLKPLGDPDKVRIVFGFDS